MTLRTLPIFRGLGVPIFKVTTTATCLGLLRAHGVLGPRPGARTLSHNHMCCVLSTRWWVGGAATAQGVTAAPSPSWAVPSHLIHTCVASQHLLVRPLLPDGHGLLGDASPSPRSLERGAGHLCVSQAPQDRQS